MKNKKIFLSFFIITAVCTIPADGLLFAQAYIPQLPANTQVTQTITIKNVEPETESDPEAKKQTQEKAVSSEENAPKTAAPKAKKQTVTQPGKFVPFFQAGGTQSSSSDLLQGPQLAPRPSGYAKPWKRPRKTPGRKPGGSPAFKPINPPPNVRPVMVPGGNAGANPGSDPRLYMPPSGIKRPEPPPAKTPAASRHPRGPKPAK